MKKYVAMLLALALAAAFAGCGGPARPEPTAAPAQSGADAVIPISGFTEDVGFFPVEVDGVAMELLFVKTADGKLRTAFNTCQVCNGSPYAYFVQAGGAVECQNCHNRFALGQIGERRGGCNPVPAQGQTQTDDAVVIPYDVLAANKALFANWKAGLS